MPQPIQLTVNGERHELPLDATRSLLSVVRDDFGLLGAKYGCGEGECGSCTVLVDGEPVRSCRTQVGEVAGQSITTVEGLARGGRLHPVQQAFVEEDALQCGFCTAGMVVSAAALLARRPEPDDDDIRQAMQGNVCRCCTYPRIVRAIRRAGELGRSGESGPPLGAEAGPIAVPSEPGWLPRPSRPWDRQGVADREYFETLGDGLVVVLPPEEARRNDRGSGPWLANGGAWLHLGGDEVATAFTGKVDFGQDNRTALTMLVAEELRMPLEAVRLVMGDTDVSPYDVGTFASRSMADAGDYLRIVAAAAREALLEMAAERLDVAIGELTVSGCRVGRRDGGASVGYGELLRAVRRVAQVPFPDPELVRGRAAGEPGSRPAGWIAGTPRHKLTASDIVTGSRRYVSDLSRPGMLHGKVLRPPAFGATLRSADVSGARTLEGVVAVQEGDFVAVAAPTVRLAVQALDSIQADWTTPAQPSEAGIVDYLRSHPIEQEGWGGSFYHQAGEVEAALGRSARRLETSYTTAYIAHVPLETRAALAEWDGGRLTVWTGTQRPFAVRAQLAETLGLAEDDIRVIVPDTGGGWGGKHSGEAAIEAARLARAAGRPVRIRWTREEETSFAYFRPFAVLDVRAGLGADGTLLAWDFRNTHSGPHAALTPYRVPNQRVVFQPTASPLPTGSYRALSATANNFARESAMDELAAIAGVDPLEFRLRHLPDDRLAAVYRAAAQRAGWGGRATRRDGRFGMGIAGGIEKGGRVATVASVRVADDGRLEVLRLVTAYEAGAIVNPLNLANQMEGAAVMGLGGALFEAIHFENGRVLNAKLSQYPVPRFGDVPEIEVVPIDRPDQPSMGAGETPIIGIAPAIANAVFAASGVRLRSMPLAPDGLVR